MDSGSPDPRLLPYGFITPFLPIPGQGGSSDPCSRQSDLEEGPRLAPLAHAQARVTRGAESPQKTLPEPRGHQDAQTPGPTRPALLLAHPCCMSSTPRCWWVALGGPPLGARSDTTQHPRTDSFPPRHLLHHQSRLLLSSAAGCWGSVPPRTLSPLVAHPALPPSSLLFG